MKPGGRGHGHGGKPAGAPTARDAVYRAVAGRGRPPNGALLLAAVSGGADSTALAVALAQAAARHDWHVTAAHLDHGLRGRAGRADARFVAELCRRLAIPCVEGHADVRRAARRRGVSIEMAARDARYRFLARTARRLHAEAVVTGHTADDQAETVLLKLCRGAGADGLSAMAVQSTLPGTKLPLWRPLIGVSRAAIEHALRARGVDWREDATNREDHALRNRIRHEVLPLLATRLNPAVREALCRAALLLAEDNAWLDGTARAVLREALAPDGALDLSALDQAVATRRQGLAETTERDPACAAMRRRVLRLWLTASDRGAPPTFQAMEQIVRLADSRAGSRGIELGHGRRVRRRYARLTVEPAEPTPVAGRAACVIPGATDLPALGVRVAIVKAIGPVKPVARALGRLPARAALSRAALGRRRLSCRAWRPGDRIRPSGMTGSRKLQDIFTDGKLPRDRRNTTPVFVCGGEVVWLPGYRVAAGWAVPAADAPALHIRVTRLPGRREKVQASVA